jgi:hypothetical protein
MKENMKITDRAIRIVFAGLAVWPALAVGPGTPGGVIILAAAAILVVTGVSGFCPLYLAVGPMARGPRHA